MTTDPGTAHIALTDPRFTRPGSNRGLIAVFQNRYLLGLLTRKGIAIRYYGSALGWMWSYIRPAAQFLMYFVVIGLVLGMNRGIDNYPVYLFSGIVTVNLFNEILRNTTSSIVDNKSLIQKIYLPRQIFPLAATGVALVHYLPQVIVLLIVCLAVGFSVTWLQLGAFLLGILILVLFTLGLGLIFGALNVAHRDWKNIVDLILMFATWTSPVLYSSAMVQDLAPNWLYQLYMLNPVTVAVELGHTAFWAGTVENAARPDVLWQNAFIGLGIAVATFALGQLVFRRLEGSFAQNL